MTDPASDLYFEIKELAKALGGLPSRSTAAVFGVCARALAPLLDRVEQRSGGRWALPDLPLALNLIEAFATGLTEASDHREIRERLDVAIPDEAPWRTYAQDTVICADAGLAAASVGDRPDARLIHSALEPLIVSMENRDFAVIRTYGENYWNREIVNDPAMAVGLGFLRKMIEIISQSGSVGSQEFGEFVRDATVLLPADFGR